jgi:hypothetical protein
MQQVNDYAVPLEAARTLIMLIGIGTSLFVAICGFAVIYGMAREWIAVYWRSNKCDKADH